MSSICACVDRDVLDPRAPRRVHSTLRRRSLTMIARHHQQPSTPTVQSMA